ncbi:MAG: flippase-like domain-containing protein [Gemmatimonadota bacterium]|nr:flippase-like domain-containing protein [Gemmatimonadota bacterium]MDH5803943.1 flippase-like domain-containing protein [Gemmatimonadota bacterium]
MGLAGAVGILISIILLTWTLWGVDFHEVWNHLSSIKLLPFVGCVAVATATFPLRTIRWRYLLQLDGEMIPFKPLWHATAIGFMANNLLPARAGEIARVYAAQKLTGVRFTSAFATIFVERVMDGLTLVLILAAAMFAGGFATGTTVAGWTLGSLMTTMAAVFTVALAGAGLAVYKPQLVLHLAERVLRLILPKRALKWTMDQIEGIVDGLDVLRNFKRFALVSFWSVVVWGAGGLSFLLCMIAFQMEIPWTAAFLLQALIAFGVAVPSAPGFFGPFEAVAVVTLDLYGIPQALAVSYVVAYHLFTFVPISLLGMWSLSRAHLSLSDPHLANPNDTLEPGQNA